VLLVVVAAVGVLPPQLRWVLPRALRSTVYPTSHSSCRERANEARASVAATHRRAAAMQALLVVVAAVGVLPPQLRWVLPRALRNTYITSRTDKARDHHCSARTGATAPRCSCRHQQSTVRGRRSLRAARTEAQDSPRHLADTILSTTGSTTDHCIQQPCTRAGA
jgi:hypothetical protein